MEIGYSDNGTGKRKVVTTSNGTKIIETELPDCYIIQPKVFKDSRGHFSETYNGYALKEANLNYSFVQDNESLTKKAYTIRGLHFQCGDKAQAKLVRVVNGEVYDVAVDLRVGSPTYKKAIKVRLNDENKRQLLIPRGFAHGFITLTNEVVFAYKCDNFYSFKHDGGIIWNDKSIIWCNPNILGNNWEIPSGIEPILSEKDAILPQMADSKADFKYLVKKYLEYDTDAGF